jgi:hypothetical protein
MQSFTEHFSCISDPRIERTKKHKLIDILFITMAAVICGCGEWEEIELYADKKQSWLRKYIELSNGIPSNDTINRQSLKSFPAMKVKLQRTEGIDKLLELPQLQMGHTSSKTIAIYVSEHVEILKEILKRKCQSCKRK